MSLPEVLLWRVLRTRPNGLKFRRQHPAGPYILDFYCESARICVEVDGQYHSLDDVMQKDEKRNAWLLDRGVRTVRIPAKDVLNDLDAVVRLIVDRCQPLHQPSAGPPPLQGGCQ